VVMRHLAFGTTIAELFVKEMIQPIKKGKGNYDIFVFNFYILSLLFFRVQGICIVLCRRPTDKFKIIQFITSDRDFILWLSKD